MYHLRRSMAVKTLVRTQARIHGHKRVHAVSHVEGGNDYWPAQPVMAANRAIPKRARPAARTPQKPPEDSKDAVEGDKVGHEEAAVCFACVIQVSECMQWSIALSALTRMLGKRMLLHLYIRLPPYRWRRPQQPRSSSLPQKTLTISRSMYAPRLLPCRPFSCA